jgi:DNA repair protein RecN (Recombination protein N)
MAERLSSSYYEIDDVKSRIYHDIEGLDFDQDRFNLMQERHYELIKIEQKYQKEINDLIDYYHDIKKELLMITDYDEYIKEARKELEEAFLDAFNSGLKLRELRQKLAKKLSKDMIEELKDLDLEKASFDIVFDDIEKDEKALLETGLDQVEFMISLNEGEPIKPLAKVASGGERARFMFALKSIYAKSNQLSMLVLDEIDIGISGKTAAKVALKMSELSKDMQLIVITHLPQVAAKADHHYGITKHKENNRMVTHITKLNLDQRIEMIGMMLSDEKLSHFAIEQAKMLLKK